MTGPRSSTSVPDQSKMRLRNMILGKFEDGFCVLRSVSVRGEGGISRG